MWECECGQAIYQQSGDDRLRCYECGREYDRANGLEVIHVLCPRCSNEITDIGRFYTAYDPDEWMVDNVECGQCGYRYEADKW
jgi:NMD protein affecting ribosome stability and mRNA decay